MSEYTAAPSVLTYATPRYFLRTCACYGMILCAAEASYRSAIRMARCVVEDIGRDAASHSGGLLELAAINENKSERDGHVLLAKKAGLSLPVNVTTLDANGQPLQLLQLQSWASYLSDSHLLHILCGLRREDPDREAAILQSFWASFRELYPAHQIFERFSKGWACPRSTYPFIWHGDEGRGRRRVPVLITNFHCVLGHGTEAYRQKQIREQLPRPYLRLLPNMSGDSRTTRFLHSVVPKKLYQEERVWNAVMNDAADQAEKLITEGITLRTGRKVWFCVLFQCGDWAFHHKAGNLSRSFKNLPKILKASGAASKLTGICHKCQAGQESIPWEYIHERDPLWMQTLYKESAFSQVPPICKIPHVPGSEEAIFAYDIFHSFHLGVAKQFIGSCLALLSDEHFGSNIDERFCRMNLHFSALCRFNKQSAHIPRLSKETIQWSSRSDYPAGNWFKASVSTLFMHYVADVLSSPLWAQDPVLVKAAEASCAINSCFRSLYESGAFIPAEEAVSIAEQGLRFLRRFAWLAQRAEANGQALFLLTPKCHALHHIFLEDMLAHAKKGLSPLNPICTSVQMDEDFLGFASRISRRVEPRRCVERCIQRHLQASYTEFVKARYIIPR